jgi:PIN domain nuclease of toxin-antitoxin system
VRLLLDSHVLLWWDNDLSRLSTAQLQAIADPENVVFVSAVSAWELGIKVATGKLTISDSVGAIAERFGFVELPITLAHGQRAASLPMLHKDPFDRMLVAQAMSEQMVLVTVDERIGDYDVAVL